MLYPMTTLKRIIKTHVACSSAVSQPCTSPSAQRTPPHRLLNLFCHYQYLVKVSIAVKLSIRPNLHQAVFSASSLSRHLLISLRSTLSPISSPPPLPHQDPRNKWRNAGSSSAKPTTPHPPSPPRTKKKPPGPSA